MENQNKKNIFEIILIIIFLASLSYAAFLSYKSIDYQVLNKLEKTPLNLPPKPTSIPQTPQSR